MSPDARQVGGDHYLKLPMQPFHFTLANGWDAGSHTILKYVSRHHNVSREEAIESLRKAYHIVEIIAQARKEKRYVNTAMLTPMSIGVAEYITVNRLDDLEALALLYLGFWLYQTQIPGGEIEINKLRLATEPGIYVSATMVQHAIENILMQRYGVTA